MGGNTEGSASADYRPEPLLLAARDGAGARLDRFVADALARDPASGVSRTRVQRWIALGAVLVDGRPRLPNYRLTGFEEIEVEPQPLEIEQAFRAEPLALRIVHADADIVVVDKQAGLVTHPAPGHWSGTLMNGLLHHFPETASLPRAGIVHRLDRDTSGLLVTARTEAAFAALTAQLAARAMGRTYCAVTPARIPDAGVVDAAIGRDPRNRLKMAVQTGPGAKPARTDYRVLARGERQALVACRLHTGRTHQIRVHLQSIGCPIVGDAVYGGDAAGGFARQALHAWSLALAHPRSGIAVRFDAPIPADLAGLLDACGLAAPDKAPA